MKRGPKPKTVLSPDEQARVDGMVSMYRDGRTLVEIGAKYGITRERVRQLMTRWRGITATSGGQHIRSKRKQIARHAKLDAKCLAKHGCTWAQYVQLRELKRPLRAFGQQKANAHLRGIAWEMTLWQWWTVWQDSGKWEHRGRGHGFAMCRLRDSGPYAAWNVYIATNKQNVMDYWSRQDRKPIELDAERLARRRFNIRKYYYRRKFREAGVPSDQIQAMVNAHCPPLVVMQEAAE